MTKPIARLKTRALLAASTLALGIQLALAADPAAVSLYVFEENTPLAEAEVEIDGLPQGRTSAEGALRLSIEPGARVLRVLRNGEQLLQLQLDLAESENAEVIATIYPDAAPSVFLESTHRDGGGALQTAAPVDAGPPGELRGRIVSSEDGKPVVGARVFVSGLPVDIITDAEGSFAATLASGTYSVSVVAASYATQTLDGVTIAAEQTTERPIELTPAGLELPEFVVLEPYIEGSLAAFVEERRTSAAVTDILGAEQISRAGDSDAAGALKRVTGLTLVGGKFVYVRGLGERYSSVLLNGAQIPSPDPTRRVVPLDLFPTDILEGVVVQKTYSAEMPGEFGGGSIGLRTKGFPDSPLLRISASLGGAQGTTFQDGLGYEGGARDWSGRDDGGRALPGTLDAIRRNGAFLRQRSPANPSGLTPTELQAVGRDVAGVYDVTPERVGPDGSLGVSGGSSWRLGDDWTVGFLASGRYSRKYDTREEMRRFFVASSAGLEQRDEIEQRSTTTEIDVGGFLVAGLQYGEHHKLRGTSLILRQTEDEAREATGSADNQFLQRYLLEWTENELVANQLAGEHSLPWFTERARFDWLYTEAQANRYAPNTREYRFNFNDEGVRELSQFGETNRSSWSNLVDNTESYDLGLNLPYSAFGWLSGSLALHAGDLERERDSYIRRYQFALRFPNTAAGRAEREEILRRLRLEQIINSETIRPDGFVLIETTQNTDNYFAEQSLSYRAATLDASFFDKLRITLGLREEKNFQQVTTFSVINPGLRDVGTINQTDRLPAFSATYWISQNQQLRLGYSETVSRPDFRELTSAPYIDPILDFTTFGNPDLVTAEITNYDLRWEYYFSPTESVSVALFRKDFTNPIEKQLLPGSGSILLTLANAEGATNQGIELDGFKQLGFLDRWLDGRRWASAMWLDRPQWANWYVSANYSWIDSEIQLDPAQSGFNTNLQRPLEGQSPYVVNFQLGHQSEDGRRESSLLYNVSGERVVQVGVDGQPDVYEQPFGQLDFNWRQKLGDHWSFRVRLRNLLDPKVEFLQGTGVLREYRRGREIGLSLEWTPF